MQDVTGRRHWRKAVIAAAAVGTMLVAGIAVGPSASGIPSRDINQVRNQVRDLQSKAEAATERFNKARNDLASVQGTLNSLKNKADREREDLQQIMSAVDDIARAAYTGGGIDPSLQVLMAEDPSEFLAQAAALDQVAEAQASQLRRTQTTRIRLAQSEAAIKDKEDIAQSYRDDMASAKSEADQQLQDAQDVLNSLQAAERERLAQLIAQGRTEGLAQAQAALASGNSIAPNARADAAVRYALSQVGDRYVAAQAGPDVFDCSGLTMAAWAQAGVSLAHLSYTQFDQTVRVPVSDIQPGDLVFYFGSGAHHVGIYVGNGKMVSASNPSDGVELIDFLGPWYGERFSGVGRVVG